MRHASFVIAILLVALLALPCSAQDAAPPAPPETAPPAVPTPKPIPAKVPAPEPPLPPPAQPEDAQRVLDVVIPAVVEVRLTIVEDRTKPKSERTWLDNRSDRYVSQRAPYRFSGLRIAADGTVLAMDPALPLVRYGEIEFVGKDGVAVPAKLVAVLRNHAGILLAPIEPPDKALPHVTFAEAKLTPGDSFFIAHPAFIEKLLLLRVEEARAMGVAVKTRGRTTQPWTEDMSEILYGTAQRATSAPVILNRKAEVIGMAMDNALWKTAAGADSWIGTSVMKDERVSRKDLDAAAKRIQASAAEAVKEIEIHFRKDSPLAKDDSKRYAYGVLVDEKGGLFVPTTLDRKAVQQIERITVQQDGAALPAEFIGLYRDLGAFLVRAKDVKGKPRAAFEGAALPRGRVFFTLSVRRRYGSRDDRVEYNRYLDVATGYKEARYPLPMKPLLSGDLIADAEGNLLGFQAPMRKEEQDRIKEQAGGESDTSVSRLYLFSEMADAIASPEGRFDTAAKPMSRTEQRRAIVWLGVEYQQMSANLARAFDAAGPTRGGARGMLVTHVYQDSPAKKLGLKVGDILLALNVAEAQAEIDLVNRRIARPKDVKFVRSRAARFWAIRRNHLIALLTALGEGREISLRYLRDGQEVVAPLKLEQAPDDYNSAERIETPSLGMTVCKVTYEVRRALRLAADAPAVVVTNVTPGSRAAVAQIHPHVLVTHVNDKPIKTPEQFQQLVGDANGKARLKILIEHLGQTRIVELDMQTDL